MRIAYVTESFPPAVNGVAHTAVRVAEHLTAAGHQPLIIAPEPGSERPCRDHTFDFPVVRVPSVAVPCCPGAPCSAESNMCSTYSVSEVARPSWWRYPGQCPAGHPWAPGRVIVGWMPCECPGAFEHPGQGHLWVRCGAPGCSATWYQPRHGPLTGGAAAGQPL